LKTAQLILSIIGLVAIALAYITSQLAFLIIALAAFVGGLFYMGAIGRRSSSSKEEPSEKKKSAKDKSQKQS
jgi:flagellar biosynthesis component FlhA